VVLLAAGSGITPTMAMLRYMDDLCLETSATLLYSVRTASDILRGQLAPTFPARERLSRQTTDEVLTHWVRHARARVMP